MSYQLICMSFDGERVTEGREFPTIKAAWNRACDMGSRWYFYPFCFVTSESGKTIVAAPAGLRAAERKRVKTVAQAFAELARQPDMEGIDPDLFALAAGDYLASFGSRA